MTALEAHPVASLDPYVPQLVLDWLDAGGDAPRPSALTVPGTLVFADVSGFTPLSERLARKGRIGSEELTDILNRVFGRLLDVASSHGGDLLKYGGDALLLFFKSSDHAARAAVAAATMQRVLRENSRIDTGAGIVRLRMSVGVHSGEVLFVLVGETHRELLLTGPSVTSTVQMESAASANEVLLSPATARAIDPAWTAGDKDGGHLLRQPRADGALPPLPFTRQPSPRAAQAIPASLRAHISGGVVEGEHRYATLAFVQFKGTDALLDAKGPAAVADELHDLITTAQDVAARHDVTFLATDIDADGGKILFSTGAPRAGVNDSDRMVLALREIVLRPSMLTVRAGVNRGPAFAVDVGAPYRRTYAVMGDATNLAARVMGKASPRGVLATASVTGDLRAGFDLTAREPFMVKGKSHPITAFDVGAAIAATRRDAAATPEVPVVGHDRECAALDRAIGDAAQGLGTAMALVGPPGLGKSRLVAHLLDRGASFASITFEGGQYATHTPLFALRPALRGLLGTTLTDDDALVIERLQNLAARLAPHLLPWLPLLGDALGVDMADTPEVEAIEMRFRRARVAALVVDLLDHALPKPAVIVVEDAQWLDDSSADVLREVIAGARERTWIVCVTTRDDRSVYLDASPHVAIHRLEPLDGEESRELLYRLMGDEPLPPLVVSSIAERASGNPLYLSQLLDAARAGQGVDALPDSLEALIASRIDDLDADARGLLRSASVLGARFPLPTLAAVLDEDERTVRDRLDELDTFLVADGESTRRFRTSLLRDVAYETLAFRRRKELHGRAAEVLEAVASAGGERPVALLSLHQFAAGRYDRAWAYAREAGNLAAATHAAVEATALYTRALDAARHVDSVSASDLATVLLALGEQSEYAGHSDRAAAAFARARPLLREDPPALAGVMLKDGWLRERSRHYADALRWYTRALRVLDGAEAPGDHEADQRACRLHAELVLSYGAVRLRQGRFQAGLPWLERAVGEAAEAGADDILAHAYYLLDWALTDLGRPVDAARYRELALPIYERLGDLSGQANVLNNLGIDAYYEGRWDEALVLYERSREARERSGDVVQLGLLANNIGEILSDQGKLDAAEGLFRDALRVWRGSNFRIGDGVATSNLGRAAARARRFDDAYALFAEAASIFDAIGAASFRADVDVREAERRLLVGDPAHALVLADAVCARFDRSGTATPAVMSTAHRIAACSLALLGRVGDSMVRLDDASRIAEQSSAAYEVALALEARSYVLALVQDPEAEAYGVAAGALFDRLGVESSAVTRLGPLAERSGRDAMVVGEGEERSAAH